MSAPLSIALPEIECIEKLESIEEEYAARFGCAPFNVSHWDASTHFEEKLLPNLVIPNFSTFSSYRFSYQITETDRVIDRLGADVNLHRGLFTPSSTTSIVCVLSWLRNLAKCEILALCPAYFSLFHVSRHFGITTKKVYLERSASGFRIPSRISLMSRKPSVLWITSPVYGAGAYLCQADVAIVDALLQAGWVVIVDECLSMAGRELVRTLGSHENFLSIYSPHKSVCLNGVKFSIVVFHEKHLAFMERWSDIWYGGINFSSSMAIDHFLSENFDKYMRAFQIAIAPARKAFNSICHSLEVAMDETAEGHFVSCYFPRLSTRLGNSPGFLRELVFATGGSLISGNRSRYNPRFGFCFRVNLARVGPQFRPTLVRVIEYLCSR